MRSAKVQSLAAFAVVHVLVACLIEPVAVLPAHAEAASTEPVHPGRSTAAAYAKGIVRGI